MPSEAFHSTAMIKLEKIQEEYRYGRIQCSLCKHLNRYWCRAKSRRTRTNVWFRCVKFEFRDIRYEHFVDQEPYCKVIMSKDISDENKEELRNFIMKVKKVFSINPKIEVFYEQSFQRKRRPFSTKEI
jgi:hypothetical protein